MSSSQIPPSQSPPTQQQQQPQQIEPSKRSHTCLSCNCPKQMFYERGMVFALKDHPSRTLEYSAYECASCSFLMLFKTKETVQGV